MMQPYLYIPGVPAGGHIAGGFWHPGPPAGCLKCKPYPSRTRPEERRRSR
jgi:hypothetical protein